MSAAAALAVAIVLAGCGSTSYFDGRKLPPSRLVNRVLVAIQNSSALQRGTLEIMDAYYDIRSGYNGEPPSFTIAGFGGALPITIQNMPEEQAGAIYGSGDGTLSLANYQAERTTGTVSGLSGFSSSIFITRNQEFVFAASQAAHVLTVVNQATGASFGLSLPGVYRVSVNPGGTVALAFVQNSNFVYYPVELTTPQTLSYSGGPSTWPLGAVDCEPQSAPVWCLLQALDPSSTSGNPKPLTFDRPVKAVFSADGNTAYILSCGPECGGTTSGITPLPIAPMLFLPGRASGLLPTQAAMAGCSASNTADSCTLAISGGSSNALVDSSTMYVVGQAPQVINGQTLFGGNLTVLSLSSSATGWATIASTAAISDGQPGATSRMIEADDNTLWIGMTGCTIGVRYATNPASGYGCLTMYNTATNKVVMLEPYIGNATGIAAVTGLHKIYAAEGGQVYIYSTVNGSSIDNQYVTVTGTAYDVAYMDAVSDGDNTVY
ncbi:MAG TPA: hypothetical protein VMD55_10850 [Terracidiphilus sp.]|nr:hypothetical protein [Terracidiphilus sp.]